MILMAYLSYMLAEVSFLKTETFLTLYHSYPLSPQLRSHILTQSLMCIQLFDLSAILTVFFCGIVMSHYTWHNVTESSRVTTKYASVYFPLLTIELIRLFVTYF